MSIIAALTKLRTRPPAQRWQLARATLMLAVTRGAIHLPFRVVSRMIGLHRGEGPELVDAETRASAAQIAWAVRTAAAHMPWRSTCLVQALAAAALLRGRGIGATLYLGVAKPADGPEALSAHAWLRCGDLVLTGAAERELFTAVASFVSTERGHPSRPLRPQHPIGSGA